MTRFARAMGWPAWLLLFGAVALPAPQALATTFITIQEWRDPLWANNGQAIITESSYNDAATTGVGFEDVLLDSIRVLQLSFGTTVAVYDGEFSMPPVFESGNMFAELRDGGFNRLFSVNLALTTLVNVDTGNRQRRLRAIGSSVFFGLALSLNELALHSTTVSVVPEPSTLSLLAFASALGVRARRRSGAPRRSTAAVRRWTRPLAESRLPSSTP